MKKLLTILMTVMVVVGLCTLATSAEQLVAVKVNGVEVDFDVPAQVINDRTLVPLRGIFEVMGAQVNWDNDTETVTANRGETSISLQIGSTSLFVNGTEKTIDVPAQLVNDRTLIPARAVAESFGATVDWDDPNQTVIITDSASPDFAAMLNVMSNTDATSSSAKFNMNLAVPSEDEVVDVKIDGIINVIAQPYAAEYDLDITTGGVTVPASMYLVQEDEQFVMYMSVEMDGQPMAMKVAMPGFKVPDFYNMESNAGSEFVNQLTAKYTDIIKVVAQEKLDEKDTVKFVISITDEFLKEVINLANEQGMYDGLDVDMAELEYPDIDFDAYMWLDKETSETIKYYMDLAPMLASIVNADLAEEDAVSFDAFDCTVEIIGLDTVKSIEVPAEIKANAIDITEGMEPIE